MPSNPNRTGGFYSIVYLRFICSPTFFFRIFAGQRDIHSCNRHEDIKESKEEQTNEMRTRIWNDKEQVFCTWRRRFVRLTPEEWVRQQILESLETHYGYPHSLIAVEVPIKVGELQKRCDAIVYDRTLRPLMLIEFKAEQVPISQAVLDQAAVYNRKLNVPYLLLSNGKQSVVAHVLQSQYEYLNEIPLWKQLSN